MESIYTKLALYGSKNECARTDNVLILILINTFKEKVMQFSEKGNDIKQFNQQKGIHIFLVGQ